jgi:hypothetical protein
MEQSGNDSPKALAPVRLEWDVQTLVLRRLCAGRPKALELMRLAALGYGDAELRSALDFDERQFEAEVDAVGLDFQHLSRAFFAHHAIKSRPADDRAALAPAALEALETIGQALYPGQARPPEQLLEELRASTFVALIERIAGDLRPALLSLGTLPRALP